MIPYRISLKVSYCRVLIKGTFVPIVVRSPCGWRSDSLYKLKWIFKSIQWISSSSPYLAEFYFQYYLIFRYICLHNLTSSSIMISISPSYLNWHNALPGPEPDVTNRGNILLWGIRGHTTPWKFHSHLILVVLFDDSISTLQKTEAASASAWL